MLPYQTITQKENGIAIVGIGGAGANVLQCFGSSSAEHVRLYTMSLDERVGRACGNVEFIQLGEGVSHGLGSGGDPEVGRQAMQESEDRIAALLADCKLLVMVVGLGGGTGSGAAPVLARMARERGLFLVSVIMMPFNFEGKRRREQAELAHEEISRLSDIVFCFENDYMEELFRNRSGARAVFEEVDRLLAKATASVPMMATSPGLINLGLDELATALENRDSRCIFGSGSGYGTKRAEQAARAAVESPLTSYHGALRFARAVIVHIAGGESMSLTEIRQAMEIIHGALGSDEVAIFFGATVKAHLGDEMRITLIASIDAEEFKTSFQYTEVPLRPGKADEQNLTVDTAQPEDDDTAPEEDSEDTPAAAEDDLTEDTDIESDTPDEPEEDEEAPLPSEDEAPEEELEEEPDLSDDEYETPLEAPEDEAPAPVEPAPAAPAPAPARAAAPARPAPVRKPAPAPAPEPEPAAPAPARPAGRPTLQQLDLFASPMRQSEPPTGSSYGSGSNLRDSIAPAYAQDPTMRRGVSMPADDLDIPPSLRMNDLKNIFPDN